MPVVSTGQITITDVHDGLNLLLSNPAHVLPSNDQGVILPADYANCICTAYIMKGPQDVTGEWNITVATSVGIAGSYVSNTYSVTALTADSAYVDFTATKSGEPALTQRFSVTRSKNAADGLSIVVSNESHVVASNSSGVVSSYTGSGTTIRVLEGAVELNAASSNSANGSFTIGTPVVSPSGKITVGGRSYSSKTATVANHSAMAADTDSVTITYPINIRRSNGTTVSLSKTQTITKSKQGGTGDTGGRGTVHVYAATVGTTWNDSEANAALAVAPHNGKIVADRVTLYNSTAGWTQTRYWTGSAWTVLGEVIDGNLLVTGSITADKINVNDLFARTITLPNDGVLKAGTTEDYAELGGSAYFKAQSGNSTIFKIAKDGSHFIDGRFITNTLPPEAFDANVIPYIRSQLSLGTPSAGGSSSITGTLGAYGVMLTTTETIASSGVGEPASIVVGYGGIEVSVQTLTTPTTAPKITVQVQRITNGGSPANVGTLKEFIGEFRRTASGSPATYEFSVPSFRVLETDSAPGAGNLQYKAVISLISPINLGDDLGIITLAASQRAAGAVSGTITWGSVLGKPDVSLAGHTHSAADITSGILATAIGGTGRTDGKVTALATSRTLTIGNSGKTFNGSADVSWSLSEIGVLGNSGKQTLSKAAHVSGSTDCHLELQAPIGASSGEVSILLHQQSRFYGQMRLRSDGFHFTQGDSNAYRDIYALNFMGNLVGNAATSTTAGSISGFNNPTAAATANTIAYRDGSADINARLFRSNYGDTSTITGAMAFRVNNGSDNYIRFCSNAAAIRTWMGADNASNLTLGTISDARLPGTFSKKQISGAVLATGANDYHFELYSPDGGGGGDIALRFHQGNRWNKSIRASSFGFRFTNGESNALQNIAATAYYMGDNGGYIGGGAGSSMRVQTPTGYIDVGSTNTGYAQFSTDRPAYYFNKSIQVNGEFKIYDTGTGLNNNGLFFYNGETTLTSGNSGGLIITGLDNDSALTLRTNGGIDRGHLYADSSNNIGFLDQNAGWKLRVDSAGMLHVADGTSTSDIRVKRHIQPIQNALAKVKRLTGNTYHQIEMGIRRAGPIAQEVQVVLPEAVSADEKGKLAVSQMGLIALLIEAVKELSTEVETMKGRLH